MGTLYKRRGSKNYMMAVTVAGRQVCQSTHTSNKRLAQKLLARWETEIFEGRFHLPASKPPLFENWADDFLSKIANSNTKRRYKSSVEQLKTKFKGMRLSDINGKSIDDYTQRRLDNGVEPATINHDLRVMHRMLHLAERKRLIARTPFVEVEFLRQRQPRQPHIVTFEEEERVLSVAPPYIRMLAILLLETGMRSQCEALPLKWDAIDFASNLIRIRESKTRAGIKSVPLSARCKNELLHWREILGPEFSDYVFPNMRDPSTPRKDVRDAWAKTLENAKLDFFWLYCCRHTFASRLSAAGVSDLFVAQMIGHSSPSILQKYSKAIDEYQREAMRKLEQMRIDYTLRETSTSIN